MYKLDWSFLNSRQSQVFRIAQTIDLHQQSIFQDWLFTRSIHNRSTIDFFSEKQVECNRTSPSSHPGTCLLFRLISMENRILFSWTTIRFSFIPIVSIWRTSQQSILQIFHRLNSIEIDRLASISNDWVHNMWEENRWSVLVNVTSYL